MKIFSIIYRKIVILVNYNQLWVKEERIEDMNLWPTLLHFMLLAKLDDVHFVRRQFRIIENETKAYLGFKLECVCV